MANGQMPQVTLAGPIESKVIKQSMSEKEKKKKKERKGKKSAPTPQGSMQAVLRNCSVLKPNPVTESVNDRSQQSNLFVTYVFMIPP